MNAYDDRIRKEILYIIEETSSAYHSFSQHSYMNADFADFASMALGQFRNALRDPELTREKLEQILRKGMKKHKANDPDGSWTQFMASYLSKATNTNADTENT